MPSDEKKFTKEEIEREIKESFGDKLVQRKEGPLIGIVLFLVALIGAKIFTALSPGTHTLFDILGYPIHFHHFHYGMIALLMGVILSFVEGVWPARLKHAVFGAGAGLVIDEYWLLLTFDADLYFTQQSLIISGVIGAVFAAIYIGIILGAHYFTRRERKLWEKLVELAEKGKIKIED